MISLFQTEIEKAHGIEVPSERLNYLTCILRSMLQVCAIASLEALRNLAPSESSEGESYIERMRHPSDGLPIEIIDFATPKLRAFVKKNHLKGWFEKHDSLQMPVVDELGAWVTFRNKKPGHGVLSVNDIKEWEPRISKLCHACFGIMKEFLPNIREDGELVLPDAYSRLKLSVPLVYQGQATVLLKVTSRKNVWKLQGQTLCWEHSVEFTSDLNSDCMFATHTPGISNKFTYAEIEAEKSRCSLFHNVPSRQTNTFEGRKKELAKLTEWLVGDEEPNACLVHGDGGYGKTTLVLEFLNNFLEGAIEPTGKVPEIISYHTAKMTKWTDEGLVHFAGISTAMEDCIKELMYCLQDVLERDWHTLEGDALISKVKTELVKQGYKRDDILLVLDNTETLADSPSDVEELSDFFEKVAKKIGRIIITSRRREYMASKAIQVSSLTDEESVRLLQRLAAEYNAAPIKQAGEARLKRVSAQLSHKPLLMDALVRHIARAQVGIDDALSSIFSKSNDELLEFLYEDAWVRMSEAQRNVYLILVSMSYPANSFSIGSACQQAEIPHGEFQLSLDETCFANITDYGKYYELEIVDLARNFFLQKLSSLSNAEKETIREWVRIVDEKSNRKAEVDKEYKEDRVAEAFRSQYAKAAKLAASKGQIGDAKEFFDMAIQEEPLNAALHDRYAWFALNKLNNTDLALLLAKKSVDINPKSADALMTLALTYYRMDEIESGDICINKAHHEGKPLSLCLLRMGIARYHLSKQAEDGKKELYLLELALDFFNRVKRELKPNTKFYTKNNTELVKYLSLTQNAIHNLKGRISTITSPIGSYPLGARPLG